MNKKLLLGVGVVFMIGLVVAAWYFEISGTSLTEILSPAGYRNIALDFSPMTLDTTNRSDCDTQTDTFIINKDITLKATITENIQDDSAGECLDYQSDCQTTYYIESEPYKFSEIGDKGNVSIKAMAGNRFVNKTICCEAYSCPQTRTSTITLTQVG